MNNILPRVKDVEKAILPLYKGELPVFIAETRDKHSCSPYPVSCGRPFSLTWNMYCLSKEIRIVDLVTNNIE